MEGGIMGMMISGYPAKRKGSFGLFFGTTFFCGLFYGVVKSIDANIELR